MHRVLTQGGAETIGIDPIVVDIHGHAIINVRTGLHGTHIDCRGSVGRRGVHGRIGSHHRSVVLLAILKAGIERHFSTGQPPTGLRPSWLLAAGSRRNGSRSKSSAIHASAGVILEAIHGCCGRVRAIVHHGYAAHVGGQVVRTGVVILGHGHTLPSYHLCILTDNVVQCLAAHHAARHCTHTICAHHLHDIRCAVIMVLVRTVTAIVAPVAVHGEGIKVVVVAAVVVTAVRVVVWVLILALLAMAIESVRSMQASMRTVSGMRFAYALSARRPVCSAFAATMPPRKECCSVRRQLELRARAAGVRWCLCPSRPVLYCAKWRGTGSGGRDVMIPPVSQELGSG